MSHYRPFPAWLPGRPTMTVAAMPQCRLGSNRVDFPIAGDAVSSLERARSILAKHRHDAIDVDHKQAIVALKIDRNSTLGVEEYLIIFGQGNLW